MIPLELVVKIRRLFYAEHHSMNSIAEAVNVHRDTVRKAIEAESFQRQRPLRPRTLIDPYMLLINESLREIPTIRATKLMELLRPKGFKGSLSCLREGLRDLRGFTRTPRYARLVFYPGEQAQCDWASFDTIQVGRAERKLSCFVMVLSYSRHTYAEFTLDQTFESFMRCHVNALRAFGGTPKRILYDNLKSAVLDRYGDAVRFNPNLLEIAGHYHFRPQACNVRRGNEKGRVERTIGYLRTSFFPGRKFRDLEDANRQLIQWLSDTANRRSWPQDREMTVHQAFQEDKEQLLTLPENDLTMWHIRSIRSDKTGYVRFDLNDYSVPADVCRKPLTLHASNTEVILRDGEREVARHARSYSAREQIDDPAHFDRASRQRPAVSIPRRREALISMIPAADRLLEMLVSRDENLQPQLRRLYSLIDSHGTAVVGSAIEEALERGTPRAESVAHIIEKRERDRKAPPVIPLDLPDRPGVRGLIVKPHDLAQYDALATTGTAGVGHE